MSKGKKGRTTMTGKRAAKPDPDEGLTPDERETLERSIARNREALEELAKR